MTQPKKFSERASELADQAAQAAGPAIGRAKEVAADLSEKAAPYASKAADATAQGVSTAAEQLDRRTNGKYASQISSVRSRIGKALGRDTDGPGAPGPPTPTT